MAERGRYVYEYPRPMVTVDAVVFAKIAGTWHLLLIERGQDPFAGQWAIPGGFLDMDEELETAAVRELWEETGLAGVELCQMHTFGTIGRDPRGRQITVVFWGIADEDNTAIKAGDDAANAKWFDIDKLPEKMAFDHDEVAKMAIERFRASEKEFTRRSGG